MNDWTHPRIANPACLMLEHDEIAAEARAAFTRRRDSYADLIKAGRITADDARADLGAWRAIAKDWTWIAFGEGQPATGETLIERMDALDTALARWFEIIDANGGQMTAAEDLQGALLCAMRWWAERERPSLSHLPHARDTAAINHAWRAAKGLPTRGQMLAAQEATEQKEAA